MLVHYCVTKSGTCFRFKAMTNRLTTAQAILRNRQRCEDVKISMEVYVSSCFHKLTQKLEK